MSEFTLADLDVANDNVEALTERKKRQSSTKDYITTTVSFPPKVWEELKIMAVKRRTNVREMMREAALDLLTKYE